MLVKQKRITADLMGDLHVLENNGACTQTHNWIPSASELDTLEQHLTFHVSRILFKYFDLMEPVRECFPSYITHKFMQLTKMKSVFLNCDLIDASENSSQAMIEILQRVHQIAVPHTNSDVLERVVFGGDCLTNERAFPAQQAMQNDPSKFSSLKGVVHRPEGLHREMNFLLVFQFKLMHLFLFPLSSRYLPALLQGNIIRQWHIIPPVQCDKQQRRYWSRRCYTKFLGP